VLSAAAFLCYVELMRSLEPSTAPGRTLTLTNQANPLLVRLPKRDEPSAHARAAGKPNA